MLTNTIVRFLESDKALQAKFSEEGKAECKIQLQEEPGEVLITLLMSENDIEMATEEAVKQVFGMNTTVSDFSVCCGKKVITFTVAR